MLSMMPPGNEIPNRNLASNKLKPNPYPTWFWLFIIGIIAMVAWGIWSWHATAVAEKRSHSLFLKVTNRQFSLFLWQNPQFMRVNAKDKSDYLPGFQYLRKVSVEPELAEELVVAPSDLLFRYHTWHRLLKPEFIARPIPNAEFMEFLAYALEWHPRNWPQAPEGYGTFIRSLPSIGAEDDLSVYPLSSLPQEVREAFQGWKNYTKEADAINQLQITYEDLRTFIAAHPNYARNYWRNIVAKDHPEYLKAFTLGNFDPNATVPPEALTPFLKIALYNAQSIRK